MGEKHPSYAISLTNLALLYESMDSYEKAEPLYTQAIEINKQQLLIQFPTLSEKEKKQFWGTMKSDFELFHSFVL